MVQYAFLLGDELRFLLVFRFVLFVTFLATFLRRIGFRVRFTFVFRLTRLATETPF